MRITTADIASITGGKLFGRGDIMISHLITDSRNISLTGPDTLFIAIRGDRNDGHEYISGLIQRGVRSFLVTEAPAEPDSGDYGESAFIVTDDSVKALQDIALFSRDNYPGGMIAVTGSAGKTIVKEWLAEVISHFSSVDRSPRSYNSQTGVPLSLTRIDKGSRYAVIEAGISRPGEMARLARIIRPETGIFTNIGDAHQENFSSMEEKCREKSLLFRSCRLIVVCAGHELVNRVLLSDKLMEGKNIFRWSISREIKGDIYIIPEREDDNGIWCSVLWKRRSYELNIPFRDRASVENAMAVVAASAALGFDPERVAGIVKGLSPVAMRMEKRKGINNCVVIGDYYNSDPGSLTIALDHLRIQPYDKKSLIVSDLLQSGREPGELAKEIVRQCERAGVSRIICVGEALGSARDHFPAGTMFFTDSRSLVSWFRPHYFRDEAILIKGARIFGFEEVSRLLEQQVHTTRLEINLARVLENLNYYRSLLKPGTRVMAMIKAFAYGAGPGDMADWLNHNGIDFLTVAYTDEGVDLRRAGVNGRIVVMSPDPGSFRVLPEFSLEPELYSLQMIQLFLDEAARNALADYPVHLKLDTGMHRLGVEEKELQMVAELLVNNRNVKLASVFSHLGSADRPDHDHLTLMQAASFQRMTQLLQEKVGYGFLSHLLNSAGIERFPQFQYDMVRIGIGLYTDRDGGDPVTEPVVRFRSEVTQVKRVSATEGIGYGFTDAAQHDRTIAVVPVGYADGLPRMLGEGMGMVAVAGVRVPLTGRICMDMCMIDVTGMEVAPGDEVEIFGNTISLKEMAANCDTIPHEILTGIPPRVKRVFYY
ncbi:MAG: bifunctional UDP-N-acetylmuramoyl-tripeptide:D-alanyl-D-alanine ligase/alanine racemase [Bacteroidales bacterium]|nr:bifunctional UDP-N-acetylmuramoyl-tripeptide:D-alanyl-D-alanine ligase/alanine racemase [Bacteroidales bacterium]